MFATTTDRECPRCHQMLPLTDEHWYMRTRKNRDGESYRVPTAYCKPCTSKYNVESQRRRRYVNQLPPGQRARVAVEVAGRCAVCGAIKMPHNRRVLDTLDLACIACADAYAECNGDLNYARARWSELFAHNRREEQLDARWRADRPRRTGHNHLTCKWRELVWKEVLSYIRARGNGAG